MEESKLPRAWEAIFSKKAFLPVIVKTLEKIHDITWSMKVNYHDHFEMVYMKKGEAIFQVSGDDVSMTANDLIIIKPGQAHKFIVSSNQCEFLVLSFKFTSENETELAKVMLTDFIEFLKDESLNYVHMALSRKNDIIGVMNRILKERDRKQAWGEYLSCLLIMELFVLVSRALKHEWEMSVKSRSVKLKELLLISKEYIENNYEKEIGLSDIAGFVFLSESYFAHTFKSEFKVSPKRYLLNVRIDAAKKLLAETDEKINDISTEVGFSSQQRFNDIFKKYEGITPLAYRKRARVKKLNKDD